MEQLSLPATTTESVCHMKDPAGCNKDPATKILCAATKTQHSQINIKKKELMLTLKPQYFGHLIWKADSLEKTLMVGKIEGRRRRGLAEDEMVGWHHWLNGHEFEQAPGDG